MKKVKIPKENLPNFLKKLGKGGPIEIKKLKKEKHKKKLIESEINN